MITSLPTKGYMSTTIGLEEAENKDWLRSPASLAEHLSHGGWRRFKHLDYISEKIIELVDRPLRLLITIPPRHGKSELISHWTPVWFLKKFPWKRIIITSYQSGFATEWGGKAKNSIESNRQELGLEMMQDTHAKAHWKLKGTGGEMVSTGIGGPITGRGGDLIIIDDPIKSQREALSFTYRESIWQWYKGTLRTRLQPKASIILLMCMTGDTPVLMANGNELPLCEIKVGDQVATYDNGKLGTSRVRNHKSNGRDYIYKITMTCGTMVRANKRHPFLVEEDGKLKWIRLKDLTTAHKIVTLKGSGESGKAKPALLMVAKNPPSVAGTALRTTTKRNGLMDIVPRQPMQPPIGTHASNIGTGLPEQSTMQCVQLKMANVLSVSSPRVAMSERIGVENYALTTVTRLIQSEDFCATTAISPLAMLNQKRSHSQWLNTSAFTTELIASIEPDGIEEIFDIQIERTENFIANGLVSHNTRWHQDDLAGRLLDETDADVEYRDKWEVINLPALAGEDDLLGRKPGEALWPEMYDLDELYPIRESIGSFWFSAEYQGKPTPEGGGIIKEAWFNYYTPENDPLLNDKIKILRVLQIWDTAYKDNQWNDRSACATWVETKDGYFLVDVWAGKPLFPELQKIAKAKYYQYLPNRIYVEDKASGTSLVQQIRTDTKLPFLFMKAVDDKTTRLHSVSGVTEAGQVWLPAGAHWIAEFLHEVCGFPTAEYDDITDVFSYGLIQLTKGGAGGTKTRRGTKPKRTRD